MASFFGHPALPIAIKSSGLVKISKPLMILCCLLTLFPDADVIAFRFGIPYESQWGHRGFTHSIVFALILSLCFLPFAEFFQTTKRTLYIMTFLSTLSHTLMDALTNGGLGVAVFWPLTSERYFFPWRPVEVSPIGVRGFLSLRGLVVVFSEILWIWIPLMITSVSVRKLLKRKL